MQLTKDRWLRAYTGVLPRFEPPVALIAAGPLAEKTPGQIAYAARKRWGAYPRERTDYYRASRISAERFGLALLPIERTKLGHDAAVASLGLRKLREHPDELWLGEDMMAHTRISQLGYREKLPDLFCVDEELNVLKVAEFATANYTTAQILAFLTDCSIRRVTYEIWA